MDSHSGCRQWFNCYLDVFALQVTYIQMLQIHDSLTMIPLPGSFNDSLAHNWFPSMVWMYHANHSHKVPRDRHRPCCAPLRHQGCVVNRLRCATAVAGVVFKDLKLTGLGDFYMDRRYPCGLWSKFFLHISYHKLGSTLMSRQINRYTCPPCGACWDWILRGAYNLSHGEDGGEHSTHQMPQIAPVYESKRLSTIKQNCGNMSKQFEHLFSKYNYITEYNFPKKEVEGPISFAKGINVILAENYVEARCCPDELSTSWIWRHQSLPPRRGNPLIPKCASSFQAAIQQIRNAVMVESWGKHIECRLSHCCFFVFRWIHPRAKFSAVLSVHIHLHWFVLMECHPHQSSLLPNQPPACPETQEQNESWGGKNLSNLLLSLAAQE